jgi:alpha-D-ribose 1-methylphosphonate 5-triphosphate synthase subunit PhnH
MQTSSTPQAPGAPRWDTLAPGLADPVHDSQTVFRALLDALARPGRVHTLAPELGRGVEGVAPAALAALYTLCDYATPVWLGSPQPALADALRFHTGAPLVADPAAAAFGWSTMPHALPPLAEFALGTAEAPEHGATLLLQVEGFEHGPRLVLRGPGIEHSTELAPPGLPAGFWTQRAELAVLFPCGVDLILAAGSRLVGIPRTTLIEEV